MQDVTKIAETVVIYGGAALALWWVLSGRASGRPAIWARSRKPEPMSEGDRVYRTVRANLRSDDPKALTEAEYVSHAALLLHAKLCHDGLDLDWGLSHLEPGEIEPLLPALGMLGMGEAEAALRQVWTFFEGVNYGNAVSDEAYARTLTEAEHRLRAAGFEQIPQRVEAYLKASPT